VLHLHSPLRRKGRSTAVRVEPVKHARRRSGIDRRGASGSGSGCEQQDIACLAAAAIWPAASRRVHTQERACRGTVASRGHRQQATNHVTCACACPARRARWHRPPSDGTRRQRCEPDEMSRCPPGVQPMYGWVRQYGLVGRSVHAIGARSCVVGARSRYFSGWSKINSDVLVGNVCYVMMLITRSSVCFIHRA